MKTVATFTTPLASLPSLTLVDSDGTMRARNGQWTLQLKLKFSALRGTRLIVR